MDLDKLIDGVSETKKRCKVCQDEKLSNMVSRWLERKAAGEQMPNLATIHRQLFSKVGSASKTKIREHVVDCLGLDHTTGKPHEEK